MIDFEKVETIFEHNLTKEEVYGLLGLEDVTRDMYIKVVKNTYDNDESRMWSINCSLYYLYYWRRDKVKAMEYADRLPDRDGKWFSVLNHCF